MVIRVKLRKLYKKHSSFFQVNYNYDYTFSYMSYIKSLVKFYSLKFNEIIDLFECV